MGIFVLSYVNLIMTMISILSSASGEKKNIETSKKRRLLLRPNLLVNFATKCMLFYFCLGVIITWVFDVSCTTALRKFSFVSAFPITHTRETFGTL